MCVPWRRPEHTVYEGLEPRPFLESPMLPMLAILLASNAFRDYKTVDAVFSIPAPPEGEVHALKWSDPDIPFFADGDGRIQKASSYSGDLRVLGHRAGYPDPPTVHDFRAESLYLVGTCDADILQCQHARTRLRCYNAFS